MLEVITPRIIKFCAEEVEHQKDTPKHVYYMINAWMRAMSLHKIGAVSPTTISAFDIQVLGGLVKPTVNGKGFRQTEVAFMHGGHASPAHEVEDRMQRFVKNWRDMTADEAYNEFEYIHPFEDGNGRVGQIIANAKSESLDEPVRFKFKPV